jgi:hypothetical protein
MTDERARRVGLNEALFRQVNEEIRGITATFGAESGTMTVICECGNSGCAEQLEVGVADYERIRSDARLYLIAHGHDFPEVEQVVESREGWEIVRKREGTPAEVSEETDPRS